MDKVEFGVIVVGGGHAGSEAALAAAKMGADTLLVNLSADKLASMPCNPSVGGLGKSHLVFELDALGGEMAKNTDFSGIQFRTLNTRRGAAVHANRAQCDKHVYSARMSKTLHSTPGLTVLYDEVVALIIKGDIVRGVLTAKNKEIHSKTVIITAGTFLRGTIHIGHEITAGGGGGNPASNMLADQLANLKFSRGRLKTGTPPRFKPESIDYSGMKLQNGDDPPPLFSWEGRRMFHVEHSCSVSTPPSSKVFPNPDQSNIHSESFQPNNIDETCYGHPGVNEIDPVFHVEHFKMVWAPETPQIGCYLTHTTSKTHEIVRSNLSKSALYGGDIKGTGARYCPSLEDKVVKFPERDSHHVFIEPESSCSALNLEYPNGLSCSLPREVQIEMARSVPGLEKAEFVSYAYAIEYDFYDPRDLHLSLESKKLHGLYFAGQVNGTTGYEEAAAQGFIAGVNAALSLRDESPLVLSRSEAYTGVMIDDLVTKGTNEPYRMFTSRAERRLLLRQDNARYRMIEHARRIGIANSQHMEETETYMRLINEEILRLDSEKTFGTTLATQLCRVGTDYSMLPGARNLPPEVISEIETQIRYRNYIERENRLAVEAERRESTKIPEWVDYMTIETMRFEAREKLEKIRPNNLGMAARIPGVNPADIAMLSVIISRGPKKTV